MASSSLRIGFVPEHFSTPLHFAVTYFHLAATLVPFPSGTGHMITALREGEIDVGIGLTEGWIAGLGPKPSSTPTETGGYSLVGTYVETPLCWAISTGTQRPDITSVPSLRGKRIGVSRIGSGSYVMGFVLANQQGWLDDDSKKPFEPVPLQTFAKLRAGVNDGTADFFMWEHFTSKRYFADAEGIPYDSQSESTDRIQRIGEIYTPWPSWHIVARDPHDIRLDGLFSSLNEGVRYFETHKDESVEHISSSLDYTRVDAVEWLKTVRFATDTRGVRRSVVDDTVATLRKAGVLVGSESIEVGMIGITRPE